MPYETEIKIAIRNEEQKGKLLKKCQEKSKGEAGQVFQRDEYYDTQDELLKEQDLTVRLRKINDRILLALKGPRIYMTEQMHKRIELEFSVVDEREIKEQLECQKLNATTIIEKRRWSFRIHDCTVVIDELPFIGAFVEIEGSSRENIEHIMKILDLSAENAVRENYTELLEQKLPGLGLPVRPNLRATFELEEKWEKTQ